MRVNVYAEEMTNRIEIISKTIGGQEFTGLRIYLELPVTEYNAHAEPRQVSGPFIHNPGDDDSSAVTFWGKRDLRFVLRKAISMLDKHYNDTSTAKPKDPLICKLCGTTTTFGDFKREPCTKQPGGYHTWIDNHEAQKA